MNHHAAPTAADLKTWHRVRAPLFQRALAAVYFGQHPEEKTEPQIALGRELIREIETARKARLASKRKRNALPADERRRRWRQEAANRKAKRNRQQKIRRLTDPAWRQKENQRSRNRGAKRTQAQRLEEAQRRDRRAHKARENDSRKKLRFKLDVANIVSTDDLRKPRYIVEKNGHRLTELWPLQDAAARFIEQRENEIAREKITPPSTETHATQAPRHQDTPKITA